MGEFGNVRDDRHRLVWAIRNRLMRSMTALGPGDRDAAFGDEADAELRALLRIADMKTDMDARHAAGWLCAARALGDTGDYSRVYGCMAGALLFPIWLVSPQLVPPALAASYAHFDPALRPNPANADGPAEWTRECTASVLAAQEQHNDPPPEASEDLRQLYELATRFAAMTPSREMQLANAIGRGSLAVLSTPEDDPLYAERRAVLSYAVSLAVMTWPFGDLSVDRVRFGRGVLKNFPSDSPDRNLALSDLALRLLERYWQSHDPEDLYEAIGIARDAVTQLPPESPHLHDCLSVLGAALLNLRDQEGTPEECDEVVDLFRQLAVDDPKGPAVAGLNLGMALLLRARSTERVDDLHEAVHVLTEALRASQDPEQIPEIRQALGEAQQTRFALIGGDPAELDSAITHLTDKAPTSAELTPETAQHLLAPAMARYARYQLNSEANQADLTEALRRLRQAVALLPPGHPLRPKALDGLGDVLKGDFARTGNLGELHEAVLAHREAVTLTPEGHARFGARLLNLGGTLYLRHEMTADGDDLRQAQECWRRAAAQTGLSCAHHATLQETAGISLIASFQRTPDPGTQLDEAVRLLRGALSLTPDHDRLLPRRRYHLAMALMTRCLVKYRRSDVREARKLADAAVAALPAHSPELLDAQGVAATARLLTDLSLSTALNRKVAVYRREIEATPPGHTQRTSQLKGLGNALHAPGARRRPRRGNLIKAAEAYQEAALQQQCAPSERLDAARSWGDVRAELGDWAGALNGYEVAVDLLHSVAPHHLVRDDQEFLLSRTAGLGAAAAACAVRCGRPELAVGLLEQARGVLLSHAFDADSDLTRLRETAPDLADRFEELRDALDTATGSRHQMFLEDLPLGAAHSPEARADLRQRLAAEWRELTGRIRSEHPKLALLRPVREWGEHEQRAMAAAGPVVLVNVSPYGSDALVVTDRSIDAVPLPKLDLRTATARRQGLEDALLRIEEPGTSRTESLRAQRVVRDTLAWLWQSVTGPVLHHLGIAAAPAGPLPRVWWAPGGVLGTLPLHAATPGEGAPGALDRVISSYTPTLRTLYHARQRTARTAGTGALVVAVGDAAGLAPLPAAHREAQHLARLLPGPEVLTGASATHSAVVAALPRITYAHFACHALGDLECPSASRLVLHDHTERPLTVRDLARLRLPSARLAYLSACDTLRTSPELADEAVHIVSALQIAGFPHVVGSLWHVEDTIGAGVAQHVYEALGTGDGALDVDRTAEALHSTVCALRDTYPQTPSLWACQVHAGP